MRLKTTFLIPFLCCAFLSSAQYSVPTINVDRVFYSWKDSGVSCDENASYYWYVFKDELNADLKQKVRYCGGSVLYVGIRNGLHLYNQGINVSCDSVTSLLKLDSNFINVLPPVVEEKVSYNIYHNSGLYYVDSTNLVFRSDVLLNIPLNDSIYNFILTCVDSIDTTGNNLFVFGTRDAMIKIAGDRRIKKVSDLKKQDTINCRDFNKIPLKSGQKTISKNKSKAYSLTGRVVHSQSTTSNIRIIDGRLCLTRQNHHRFK